MANDFTWWDALSIVCRVLMATAIPTILFWFHARYSTIERIGMGIAGGCCLLTVSIVIEGDDSPFSDWGGALFALGLSVYWVAKLADHLFVPCRDRTKR